MPSIHTHTHTHSVSHTHTHTLRQSPDHNSVTCNNISVTFCLMSSRATALFIQTTTGFGSGPVTSHSLLAPLCGSVLETIWLKVVKDHFREEPWGREKIIYTHTHTHTHTALSVTTSTTRFAKHSPAWMSFWQQRWESFIYCTTGRGVLWCENTRRFYCELSIVQCLGFFVVVCFVLFLNTKLLFFGADSFAFQFGCQIVWNITLKCLPPIFSHALIAICISAWSFGHTTGSHHWTRDFRTKTMFPCIASDSR